MSYDPGFSNLPQPAATPFESRIAQSVFDKTSAPGTGDDFADGWTVGSMWYDSTHEELYVCTDSSLGAAVWQQVTLGIGGAGGGVIGFTASGADAESAEEGVLTVTVPAGTMAANGDQLRLFFSGTSSGDDGKEARIVFDGEQLTIPVGGDWTVDVTAMRTGTGSAKLVGLVNTSGNGCFPARMIISSGIVWTGTVDIDFNVWSESAGTVVTGDFVSVEFIPKI